MLQNVVADMNGNYFRCAILNKCGIYIYSDSAKLIVINPVQPSVSITTTDTLICIGESVTFSALPVNGGLKPVFQWKINNTNTGKDSDTYTGNDIKDGDIISCKLVSNAGCIAIDTAISNKITIRTTDQIVPQVSISASDNNVCFGKPVYFNAITINGGNTLSYKWLKNGVKVGDDTSVYVDSALKNGDIIKCEVRSALVCSAAEAISNSIVVIIKPLVYANLLAESSASIICPGKVVYFYAIASNESLVQDYDWIKNGVEVGDKTNFYIDSTIKDGDKFFCVTALGGEECLASDSVISNIVVMHLF